MKQVAADFGGTRNGMVVSWPRGIKAKNEIRTQFSHVIDVAPTVLQAGGPAAAEDGERHRRLEIEGTSLVYSFDDAKAKERHTTQYFEISGNRAIYHEGWFARTIHRAPWEAKPRRTLKDDSAWQLLRRTVPTSAWPTTWRQRIRRSWPNCRSCILTEAAKYHVLPMDDRIFERLDGAAVGRPDLMARAHLDHTSPTA